MFDHSNKIEPRRLNKLTERLERVTGQHELLGYDIGTIAGDLTRDERSALSMLCPCIACPHRCLSKTRSAYG